MVNKKISQTNQFQNILFKVQVFESNGSCIEMHCLGKSDVYSFIEEQKLLIGLSRYQGYKCVPIKLSIFAKSVFNKKS
jgi:hypothetical protein